ncbi:unnamed protein product [Vicia faba]|uniref:Uncharacterized protein n=1 Tax=Vicia faba TaxID=3906 RepID=A0AAV1B569_VICFA|nr:unnamed protein product [Vicia faba]
MDAQNPQLLNPIFERRKRHMPKKNGIYYRRKEGSQGHVSSFYLSEDLICLAPLSGQAEIDALSGLRFRVPNLTLTRPLSKSFIARICAVAVNPYTGEQTAYLGGFRWAYWGKILTSAVGPIPPLYSSSSNESVDFCSSLSAINTYISLLRGIFYPLKEHLNSRSWYGLFFPPWMNRLDSFLFFRHLCTSLGKSFETSCPRR